LKTSNFIKTHYFVADLITSLYQLRLGQDGREGRGSDKSFLHINTDLLCSLDYTFSSSSYNSIKTYILTLHEFTLLRKGI
jgi:hypothetical protein